MSDDWNDATIAQLRTLWDEGLTTTAIAARLRRSKNTIVGKAHRLGLPARPSAILGGPQQALRLQRLVDWLDEIARADGACPNNTAIADHFGLLSSSTASKWLHDAVNAKLLRVEMMTSNLRRIVLLGSGLVLRPGVVGGGAGGDRTSASAMVSRTARRMSAEAAAAGILARRQAAAAARVIAFTPARPANVTPLNGACRWPMWGHTERPAFGEHRFCDAVRYNPRHRYCAAHAAIAFARPVAADAE